VKGLMQLGVRQHRTEEELYFFLSRQEIDDFFKKCFICWSGSGNRGKYITRQMLHDLLTKENVF